MERANQARIRPRKRFHPDRYCNPDPAGKLCTTDRQTGVAVPELYLRGDQIATYTSVSSSGNNNGIQVTLTGVTPLGSATDIFRVVVRQVGGGQTSFLNGQFVDIYRWPDTDPPSPPIYANLGPQHDAFQGRASSAGHQIFQGPNILFQVAPITPGTIQYGPGPNPPRNQQLPFSAFPSEPPPLPCFVAGTRVDTPEGPRSVEDIVAGDLVLTRDHGARPVAWAGQRRVVGVGSQAPVRITAGALGNARDLWLSPAHRVLVLGPRAELLTGHAEALVPVHLLADGDRIARVPRDGVTYVHLLFDRHEIVTAEGIPCESLWPGDAALLGFGAAARDEILTLFPEIAARTRPPLARAVLRWAEAVALRGGAPR